MLTNVVFMLKCNLCCCFHSDGTGRTGTYILIDMVLNRMAKGEISNKFTSHFYCLKLYVMPDSGFCGSRNIYCQLETSIFNFISIKL